jgi:hypothetical protein
MWGHSRKPPKALTRAGKAGFLGKQLGNIETRAAVRPLKYRGFILSLSIKSPQVIRTRFDYLLKKNMTRENTRLKRHLKTWGENLGFWGVK